MKIELLTKNSSELVGYPFRSGKKIWLHLFIEFDEENDAKSFGKNINEAGDKIEVLHKFLNEVYKKKNIS